MPVYKSRKLDKFVKKGGFYQTVVEDGSDIIFVVDFSGNILYHNDSTHQILGYRSKSLIGKNILSYVLPEDRLNFDREFKVSQKKAYNHKVEFRFQCKDKSFVYLEFNSINLWNKEEIEGLILDCRDITQRKRDAEELLRLQKAKEQFLANISHEVRTPINGIAGMATLLSMEQNPEERQTYLNAIKHSAENLKVIINDILDIAAIQSGKLKFEQVPFNLTDLLPSTINSFRFQAQEKKLLLDHAIDEKANRMLVGDPVRLNQILINLLGNAIKFTYNGSILLTCSIVNEQKDTSWVQFSVKDTGVGIPAEKLETIFESFSQADTSVTRKFGGTGLGLTIVKQLVEMQNGKIEVQSKENVGSVFTITIPFLQGKASALSKKLAKSKQMRTAANGMQNLNVLLVEDNDINRLYAQSVLRRWNCRTDTAENGLVAVERVKSKQYDVILMDVQMPVMDGYEATKAIRMMPSPVNEVPIVALTANATRADVDKCLAAGMNDYLAKPFTPEDLFRKLFDDLKLKASEEQTLFDLNYLKKVSGNNMEFIREMIQTFSSTLPPILSDIQEAMVNKDWVKTGKLIHQIKPSLTLMGIHALKEPVADIDQALKKVNKSGSKKEPSAAVLKNIKHFIRLLEKTNDELTKMAHTI
ncbi:MAG: ATP-binding protein [Cyclobacteriaceae bacterium]|nr:ATP-binding protein [Cyclobacteriaceae bacterium]